MYHCGTQFTSELYHFCVVVLGEFLDKFVCLWFAFCLFRSAPFSAPLLLFSVSCGSTSARLCFSWMSCWFAQWKHGRRTTLHLPLGSIWVPSVVSGDVSCLPPAVSKEALCTSTFHELTIDLIHSEGLSLFVLLRKKWLCLLPMSNLKVSFSSVASQLPHLLCNQFCLSFSFCLDCPEGILFSFSNIT